MSQAVGWIKKGKLVDLTIYLSITRSLQQENESAKVRMEAQSSPTAVAIIYHTTHPYVPFGHYTLATKL